MSKIEENVAWENMYSALFYAIVDEERYDEASLLELEREFIFHMSDAIPELKQLSVTFASSDLQNVEECYTYSCVTALTIWRWLAGVSYRIRRTHSCRTGNDEKRGRRAKLC